MAGNRVLGVCAGLVLGLLISAAAVEGLAATVQRGYEHLFPVFRDLDGLHTQPARMRRAENGAAAVREHAHVHTYAATDTTVHLEYRAVEQPAHTLALLSPTVARSVSRISCGPARVEVRTTTHAAAQALLAAHAAVQGSESTPPPNPLPIANDGEGGSEVMERRDRNGRGAASHPGAGRAD